MATCYNCGRPIGFTKNGEKWEKVDITVLGTRPHDCFIEKIKKGKKKEYLRNHPEVVSAMQLSKSFKRMIKNGN